MTYKARTWADVEAWFTGEDTARAVFYSPDTNPEWDDLWFAVQIDTTEAEIGRGMRSISLSLADLEWLRRVLVLRAENSHSGEPR
jgi:hypothetical protein